MNVRVNVKQAKHRMTVESEHQAWIISR